MITTLCSIFCCFHVFILFKFYIHAARQYTFEYFVGSLCNIKKHTYFSLYMYIQGENVLCSPCEPGSKLSKIGAFNYVFMWGYENDGLG